MPSQSVVTKILRDPINLLVIGAALAITFLPFTAAVMVNRYNEAHAATTANHLAAPAPSVTPEIKVIASR